MARRKSRTLTEVELEFMQVIWSAGEVGTEDIIAALRRQERHLSDGAVRRMLAILVEKGFLERRREGLRVIYKPTVPEDKAHLSMVADLLHRAFGGSAMRMVASILDVESVSPRELREIRKLIAQREREKEQ